MRLLPAPVSFLFFFFLFGRILRCIELVVDQSLLTRRMMRHALGLSTSRLESMLDWRLARARHSNFIERSGAGLGHEVETRSQPQPKVALISCKEQWKRKSRANNLHCSIKQTDKIRLTDQHGHPVSSGASALILKLRLKSAQRGS